MSYQYKVLELFAGMRSFSIQADLMGCKTFTIDLAPLPGISLVKDINLLKVSDIPFYPDIIWVGFPCTTYSVLALSKHRDHTKPKSVLAKNHDRLFLKVIHILRSFPASIFYIENPRGMLRKMQFMKNFERTTVTYCQYGYPYQKPTDIWSNNLFSLFNPDGWRPLPCCSRNSSCHTSSPRGSYSGLRSIDDYYTKCSYPVNLSRSILISTITKLNKKHLRYYD